MVEIVGINEPIPSRVLALGNEFLLGRRVLDRYKVTFDGGAASHCGEGLTLSNERVCYNRSGLKYSNA